MKISPSITAIRDVSLSHQHQIRYENAYPWLSSWWKGAQHGSIQHTYRQIIRDGGQLTPAQLALTRS